MIVHVYNDPTAPDEWCGVDENDNWIGTEIHLGVFRNIFNTVMHRGAHPSTARRPRSILPMLRPDGRVDRYFSVYWFEKAGK